MRTTRFYCNDKSCAYHFLFQQKLHPHHLFVMVPFFCENEKNQKELLDTYTETEKREILPRTKLHQGQRKTPHVC